MLGSTTPTQSSTVCVVYSVIDNYIESSDPCQLVLMRVAFELRSNVPAILHGYYSDNWCRGGDLTYTWQSCTCG